MRLTRVLVVAALAASAAAVAPVAAATPPTSPYTAFTVEGTAAGTGFDSDVAFLDTQVQVVQGTNAGTLQFIGTPPSESDDFAHYEVDVIPSPGTLLSVGTFPIAVSGNPNTVTMQVLSGEGSCSPSTGTVDITQLDIDGSNNVTAAAGSYTANCGAGQAVQGQFRWNSTQGFGAVASSPTTWDFGRQLAGANGTAKRFTFTNSGTTDVTFGTASISPGSKNYAISHDLCSGVTVLSGGTCALTVIPHAQKATEVSAQSTLVLTTDLASGLRTRVVELVQQPSDTPNIFSEAGPGRIKLFWGQLPAPVNARVSSWTVLRGTTSTNATPLKTTSSTTSTDTNVTPGKTYYYAVRPNYTSGSGDDTPTVAAIAWPKYSPGMYHRLGISTRFTSGHKVTAGHPYSLPILGAHGIPSSHVSAVDISVLAAKPSATTSVTVYPSGSRRPSQADLTLSHGTTRSNFALVQVGSGGKITISTSHGTTPVTIDVYGYYSASGLSSKYGTGAAKQTYFKPGTILDTKAEKIGALPSGYYLDLPVNFDQFDTPHVTSLVVQITAYSSKAAGTLAAYATNSRTPSTTVLAYGANSTTSTFATISSGIFFDNGNFRQYPSIRVLNRGSRSVQLIVNILGFYDDDTFYFGERYTPSAPLHLSVTNPLHTGSQRLLNPGSHANIWTSSLNLKVSASAPSATTTLSFWPRGLTGVGAPAHGQLHANAHQATIASTQVAVGIGNRFYVRNAAGTTSISVWSFGRFDAFPVPNYRGYASVGAQPAVVARLATAPASVRSAHRAVPLR
jgi:hypothetical protein